MQEAAERRAPCGRAAVSMSHANISSCSEALQPHPSTLFHSTVVKSQWPLCNASYPERLAVALLLA